MSIDEKMKRDDLDPTIGDFDRRAFLKILGAAFSVAVLPEALSGCADGDASTLEAVEALTAYQTVSVVRPEDLSPCESEREKNCVAGGYVRDGDSASKVFSQAVLWYVDIRSER